MNVPVRYLLGITGALTALAATPLQAVSYNVNLNTSYFGWLDQYSLDSYGLPGNDACVPTSSTNAMTYLQNAYSGYYGTGLTGTTYSSWETTAGILIGPDYMNTTEAEGGTDSARIPYALSKYIISDRGYTQTVLGGMYTSSDYWEPPDWPNPGYITDSAPTSGFFLDALGAGAATMFSIMYPPGDGGGGHFLLASGLVWDDANNDGIIQFSEEATLNFIDPLDPAYYDGSGYPASGPKVTSGHLYYDSETEVLKMDYSQYDGSLPSSGEYSPANDLIINTVLTINVVPEPQSWAALAGMAALALCWWRRGGR